MRRVHKNGSLIFRFVNKRDEGWYGCEAEDSKGNVAKSDFVRLLVEGTELLFQLLARLRKKYQQINL